VSAGEYGVPLVIFLEEQEEVTRRGTPAAHSEMRRATDRRAKRERGEFEIRPV